MDRDGMAAGYLAQTQEVKLLRQRCRDAAWSIKRLHALECNWRIIRDLELTNPQPDSAFIVQRLTHRIELAHDTRLTETDRLKTLRKMTRNAELRASFCYEQAYPLS